MNLIFLDTECTGLEAEDRLIQLAYKWAPDHWTNVSFKPPLPIKIEAMATHHVTEEMVAGCSSFVDSYTQKEIARLIDAGGIVVAHNAKFDIGMLLKEGIRVPNFICTQKVAMHLDPEGKIPSYKLQYLRYLLKLNVEATAHDAMGDVLVLEKLYERLAVKMSVEQMIEVSKKPFLFRTFKFGKHIGKKIEDVAKTAPDYLEWLLKEKMKDSQPDEDWVFTLNHYLNGNS